VCLCVRGVEAGGRREDGIWALAGPLAWGGAVEVPVVVELVDVEVGVELEVEVDVEVEVGVEVEVEVEVGVEVVGVAVEVEDEVVEVLDVLVVEVEEEVESVVADTVPGVVAVTPGRQLSVSDAITPDTGNDNEDIGVFGGASTKNVSVSPPTMVAVIVHVSAAAVGNPTVAIAANIAPVSAPATASFRLLDTTAYLLLPFRARNPTGAAGRRRDRTLLAASEVCKAEPILGGEPSRRSAQGRWPTGRWRPGSRGMDAREASLAVSAAGRKVSASTTTLCSPIGRAGVGCTGRWATVAHARVAAIRD